MADLINIIDKRLAKIANALGLVVRRGIIERITSGFFAQITGFGNESYPDVEVWQEYGFASRPPTGTEAVIVKPGNRGEGAIAVATNNRNHRPDDLDSEEVVVYGKDFANQVRMKPNGDILLKAEDEFIEITEGGMITLDADDHGVKVDDRLLVEEIVRIKDGVDSGLTNYVSYTGKQISPGSSGQAALGPPPDNYNAIDGMWIKIWLDGDEYAFPVWKHT